MTFDAATHRNVEHNVAAYVERTRPPALCRAELDIGFRVVGQSIELFEIQPVSGQPNPVVHMSIAKATYVRTRDVWQLDWAGRDQKWHRYAPLPEAPDLARVFEAFDHDPENCFRG